MTKHAKEKLERVNLVVGRSESEWLDQLAVEIRAETGAKVSRSEIVRAAVATLRELHKSAPSCPARLIPLARCTSGLELMVAGISAIRWAATR
jgi:hypothetical protein